MYDSIDFKVSEINQYHIDRMTNVLKQGCNNFSKDYELTCSKSCFPGMSENVSRCSQKRPDYP